MKTQKPTLWAAQPSVILADGLCGCSNYHQPHAVGEVTTTHPMVSVPYLDRCDGDSQQLKDSFITLS